MSGSTSKTSVLKLLKTFGQADSIPTPSSNEERPRNTRSVILERPQSQLFKVNETEFSLSVLMIKTWPPLLPTLQKIYFIVFLKYWFAPVELTWQSRVPSYCFNCRSKLTMEDGVANKVSIRWFHCSLCYECLLWAIWKLRWSFTFHCEDCDFPNWL